MTFLETMLLGLGVLFIASALDGSSLSDTLHKILNNETINWSGQ